MEGESEGKKHQCVVVSQVLPLQGTWPTTQAYALTGNGNSDPSVPRRALNPLSHTTQGYSFTESLFSSKFLACSYIYIYS